MSSNEESNTTNVDNNKRDLLKAAGAGAIAVGAGFSGASIATDQNDKLFTGKTAFITGAARGIGLACAEVLASNGANVTLFDIAGQIEHIPYPLATKEDLQNAKTAVENHGVKALAIQGDVRDRTALDNAVKQTVDSFGSLDFVIANAGVTQPGLLETISDDAVQTITDINLLGAIKTIQAATPILREQNSGRVILMSSVTGRAGSDMFPVYSATKWGMIGLAKTTALALGKSNVTSNAICPVLVRTKLLENDYVLKSMGLPSFEAFEEFAKSLDPMGAGFVEPEVIANTVKFICSDDAPVTTGEVFDVGGVNANWPS